ncbi:uridine kinase [Konateibacter massiliensis]|uniref:uridine kinase n=1 Tax=Konateibacter massiliensis TaxID=2002841 RepID=UPI000C148DC3|nr:uridine kinase [Konateibacter massiliensis]
MNRVYVIGVAGGSASGKTTIVNNLKEFFKNDIELISHDYYYKAHYDMPFEEREKLNYDHPNSFDTDLLISNLNDLKNGKKAYRPVYSYSIHNRTEDTVILYPKKVIIVEGILILENEELRNMMDTKIYVDADADERLMRRILRDIKERGRSIDSVIAQYSNTVKPMHEQFIEPSKKYADIIIPRGGENLTALNILKEHLNIVLNQ